MFKGKTLGFFSIVLFIPFFLEAQFSGPVFQSCFNFSCANTARIYGRYCLENPANSFTRNGRNVGILYFSRFLLPELGTGGFYTNTSRFGGKSELMFSYFGSGRYNQSTLSLSHGIQVARWLSAGIRINYHHVAVKTIQRKASALSGEIGIIGKTANGISVGVHGVNLNRSGYVDGNDKFLPAKVKIGIAYSQDTKYYLSGQINWQDFMYWSFCMEMDFWLNKYFAIQSGISLANSSSYTFGTSCQMGQITLQLTLLQHVILGTSSAVLLNYQIGGDE